MLVLKKVTKEYAAGDLKVLALKDIDISFRKNEFVSVLGPSGCGKTTLLNIVGGLDQYTSGDLKICGKSTKEFKDRDWDSYRNHSIGFVFQSYNLISHQTVLSNVELALTLSGVSKTERREKAIAALEKVGLKEQINKKPNQMSGGQMQRVAIARALVNDPEIILADEPTGALDTETSVQIMEILKNISKEKLIIMVTHNPEIAKDYSTRIIKLLDGKVMDDSNPYSYKEEEKEYVGNQEVNKDTQNKTIEVKDTSNKTKKPAMSFFTALNLSLNNLLTKKARTFMTSFAGSIGIIGIALILSLSNGVQKYIDRVQEETLSTYPIMIESETIDVSTFFETMGTSHTQRNEHEMDKVYSNNIMTQLMSTLMSEVQTNDLKSLKEYIESDECNIKDYTNDIQYGYSTTLNIYSSNTDNGVTKVNPCNVFADMGGGMVANAESTTTTSNNTSTTNSMSSMGSMGAMGSQGMDVWTELIDNQDLLSSQYDIVDGRWPKSFDEVVLIVDEHNEISDFTLYTLGLKEQSELKDIMTKIMSGEETENEMVSFTYEEILDLTFKMVLAANYYEYNEITNKWVDKQSDEEYMKNLVDNGLDIKVVGIIRPNEDAVATSASGAIGYLSSLTEYIVNETNDCDIVKKQMDNTDTDVFSGIKFDNDEEIVFTIEDVNSYIATLPEEEQIQMQGYLATLSEEETIAMFSESMKPETTAATLDGNKTLLGISDIDEPSSIYIYAKDFEMKDSVTDIIKKYNKKVIADGEDDKEINYTDYVALIMSSVSSVINAISYILIAFVAISLVVSSIMIGIITYISVLERTKEIGILRSIGASKRDISRVFNAETAIVGFVAGFIGIVITMILNIPINIIIKNITDIGGLSKLPPIGALILIAISIILTLIAGLIPSRVASKKDPVVALRTE